MLKKSQDKIKRYIDRNRKKEVKYKVENSVSLSMKNLMWQMRNRKIKKLIERFVKLYKIKKIISKNIIELSYQH